MTPRSILLFAAGFGTRMRPLTDTLPKPLIPVAGRALIDHARGQIPQSLALTEVVNAHYRADQLVIHLAGTGVHVEVESPDVLETGGGIKNALHALGTEPVFTLNTDAIWGVPNPLEQLLAAWNPDKMDALLLSVPVSQAIGRAAPGDLTCGPDGCVVWGGDLVYTGAQIIKTERIAAWPEAAFSLHPIWNAMQAEDKLHCVTYTGAWCDVGRPENIPMAEDMLRAV